MPVWHSLIFRKMLSIWFHHVSALPRLTKMGLLCRLQHRMERTFGPAEIQKFVDLTGDGNPIHTDIDAARRKGHHQTKTQWLLWGGWWVGAVSPGLARPRALFCRRKWWNIALSYRSKSGWLDILVEDCTILCTLDFCHLTSNRIVHSILTRVVAGLCFLAILCAFLSSLIFWRRFCLTIKCFSTWLSCHALCFRFLTASGSRDAVCLCVSCNYWHRLSRGNLCTPDTAVPISCLGEPSSKSCRLKQQQ